MLETEQHAVADHDVILGKSEQGYLKPNGALGEADLCGNLDNVLHCVVIWCVAFYPDLNSENPS